MKKLFFLIVLSFMMSSSYCQNDNVALSSKITINKKNNCKYRYYYYPNLEAYFDLLEMVYYFKVQGEWISAEELPKNYGGYSVYNKTAIIINDFDDDKPYTLFDIHKKNYPYNSKGHFNIVEFSSILNK